MVKDVSSRVVQYCFSSIFVYMKERNVVEFADCIGLIHCLSRETRAPVRKNLWLDACIYQGWTSTLV